MARSFWIEHTDPGAEVLRRAFPSYTGRKFEVCVQDYVSIQGTTWSEGSKSDYRLLELSTGRIGLLSRKATPKQGDPMGWIPDVDGSTMDLRPGFAVVEHVIFRGADLGLRAYVHPDNAARLLPDSVESELPEADRRILGYFAAWRSCPERKQAVAEAGGTEEKLDALAAAGYLKRAKNGATSITVKGRNVAGRVD